MKKTLFIFLAAALTLASCSREELLVPDPGTPAAGGETTLTFRVPGPVQRSTRAIPADDASVNDLFFLLFNEQSEEFEDYVLPTAIVPSVNGYRISAPFPEGVYKTVAVANWLGFRSPDMTPDDYLRQRIAPALSGKTLDEAITSHSTADGDLLFGYDNFGYPGPKDYADRYSCFLMGSKSFTIPENRDSLVNQIDLVRSLAGIDVTVTAADFTLTGVRPINMYSAAHLFPSDDGALNLPFFPSTVGEKEAVLRTVTGNACTGQIYVPETPVPADADDFRHPSQSWKNAPALMIRGEIDGEPRWFRVNLRLPDPTDNNIVKHVPVERNHRYKLTITGVTGYGYATENAARKALPGDLTLELESIDDNELTHYVYNGQYYLAVNELEEFESWESADPNGYKLEQELKITTDHPGGWRVDTIVYEEYATFDYSSPDIPATLIPNLVADTTWGLRLDALAGIEIGSADGENQVLNDVDSYRITVPPNHSVRREYGRYTTYRRVASVVITAGALRIEVPVSQKAGGVLAAPGVIGIGMESGKLTLAGSREYAANAGILGYANQTFGGLADETVYITYFKWGSLIALSSAPQANGSRAFVAENIMFAPAGYNGTTTAAEALDVLRQKIGAVSQTTPPPAATPLAAGGQFGAIPYRVIAANATESWPANDAAAGLGNPCTFYFGSGWRLPGSLPWGSDIGSPFGSTVQGSDSLMHTLPGANTYWISSGDAAGLPRGIVKGTRATPDWSMFLPASGLLSQVNPGINNGMSSQYAGYYWSDEGSWSSESSTGVDGSDADTEAKDSGGYDIGFGSNYLSGSGHTSVISKALAIRCVN